MPQRNHSKSNDENTIPWLKHRYHRWYGPKFCGKQQHQHSVSVRTVRNKTLGWKRQCESSIHFHETCQDRKAIFPEADDPVLDYLFEDLLRKSNPRNNINRVLPMALVNAVVPYRDAGPQVPMFNPKEIVENVRRNIRGEDMVAMMPWCRGFTGKVVEDKKKRGVFSTFGVAEMLEHPLDSEDDTPGNLKVLIKELPIGTWTQKYKEFLEEMLVSNTKSSSDKDKKKKKTPSYLLDYNANHTDTRRCRSNSSSRRVFISISRRRTV